MRIALAASSLLLLVPMAAPAANAVSPGSCTTTTPALGVEVTCSAALNSLAITVPTGAETMTATVLGGGGGGGGAQATGLGGAGSNGAKVVATVIVTGLTAISVTVGAGGDGGSGATYASGDPGGASTISSGPGPLINAGGGNGGAGSNNQCSTASSGAPATGSSSVAGDAVIEAAGGGAGGAGAIAGGNPTSGGRGSAGSVRFTFYGPGTASPNATVAAAPAVRSFAWRGQGSGSTSGTFTEGTWQTTPSASEWTLPGHVLLGWATDPQFPVSIAQQARGAYDGVIDGRRMIFIPAGKPTFVSGDASLHAIWAPISRVTLIGRC